MAKEFENEKHRKKILDRIQKLLATANGTQYEAEAETAMRMAQGYMKSYGVSMSDVELQAELKDQKIVREILTEHANRKNPERWEQLMAISVGIIFDCQAIRHYTSRGESKMMFLGFEKDVGMAKIVFHAMYVSCRGAAVKLCPGGDGKIRLSFMYGCAERIYERAKAEKQEAQKEKTGRYELMVVSKNQLIRNWAKENLNLSSGRQRRVALDPDAYERGRKHGNKMDLMNREKVQVGKPLGLTHQRGG